MSGGGKGVGSQGDGAAQFVARSAAAQQAAVEILEHELGMSCLKVTLRAAPQTPKAHTAAELAQIEGPAKVEGGIPGVRKAVIPAAGQWLEKDRLLDVARFVEKPSAAYARRHLRIPGLPEGEYLAFFGQYVIKPRVFDFLEDKIVHGRREWGEFQLTSALEELRQEDGFLGLVIDGQCYDIGLPGSYLQTLQAFSPETKTL